MQVVITAVGPDNRGLADPIIHHVTSAGANICEIQMFDHDSERLFSMLLRMDWPDQGPSLVDLTAAMRDVGRAKGLAVRTWSRDQLMRPLRLAICTTFRLEPATAILEAISDGRLRAIPAVMIGNRPNGRAVAERFGVPWRDIGDSKGHPNNQHFAELLDEHEVDLVVLARYMRVLPPSLCWMFGGGRIINLHHGLLPSFPGATPYQDAYSHRMLTYGATIHFIVPELDAGNQIIHQTTFTVAPGTPLAEVMQYGQTEHEPRCLVEGLRRVVDREVELHFQRVVPARRD